MRKIIDWFKNTWFEIPTLVRLCIILVVLFGSVYTFVYKYDRYYGNGVETTEPTSVKDLRVKKMQYEGHDYNVFVRGDGFVGYTSLSVEHDANCKKCFGIFD